YPNLIPDRNFYGLAGGKKLQFVIKDRVDFYNKYSEICFGLSHFYDAFENGNDEFYKNKYFYFSHEGQNIKFKRYSPKEMYYAFVNNPSKDIVYLMNGIIPIVSRKDGHYKELIEKKMAIFIDNIQDFEKILNMPVSKIYEYRENIYNNLDLFTFENVASKIIDEFNTRDININENMWYPIPTFDGFKNCICFIIDESYISYLSVCIQSLLDNASEHNLYDIYILYSGYLDQFIINKITSNNAKKNISIKFLKIDNFIKIIPDKIYKLFLNNIHKHISIATYYRFFIPSLFVNFEKVIYLDSDMLINSDISKLYDIDMNDFKLLAVKDIIVNLAHAKHKEIWEKKIVDSCKKCGIKDCSKYFNAGVLVFNMNKISFKDTIACFKMLKKIKDPYLIDQDILNAVFQNDVKVLDDTSWNYQNTLSFIDQDYKFYMFMDDCKNINIYHFISQYKPWLYPYIPNADIWWKYAKKTPFYEEILFNNISKMSSNETYGAVEKVKAHLSYKLGKELLSIKENKLKVLILPFALIFIYIKHKISNLIFKLILISNPNLKSLPLNHYSDYQEALKIQNYLSYKLGNLLIKHPLTFVFRVAGLYKEWKRGR
ncbi:glycosyltransferase family 8 protein, partial [Campylobacter jejuni]|nr:glycosyltransferase family 8 protein [Campylobacter jejuni]